MAVSTAFSSSAKPAALTAEIAAAASVCKSMDFYTLINRENLYESHKFVGICDGTADIRDECGEGGGSFGTDDSDLLWAFESRRSPEALRRKVRLVGRVMGRAGLAWSLAITEGPEEEDPKRRIGDEQEEAKELEDDG